MDAYSHDDARLAAFYFRRFRPEFEPAVTAWIATKPLTNAQAPLTPFDMPQYTSRATQEADALEAKGAAGAAVAQAYLGRADRYTLCVVLFATALFFAGISTRLRSDGSRMAILGVGWVTFLGALVWMATFPINL